MLSLRLLVSLLMLGSEAASPQAANPYPVKDFHHRTIEQVRRHLLADHPSARINLFGRSGGGYLVQEYLAKYSKHVERAFAEMAPNPLVMKKLGFLEGRHLYDTLNAADPQLNKKLEVVLKKKVVSEKNLMWILFRLGYAHDDPGPYPGRADQRAVRG